MHIRIHAETPHLTSADVTTLPQNAPTETPTLNVASATRVAKKKEKEVSKGFFRGAQQRMAAPLVPFVWDATNTSTASVQPPSFGTGERHGYTETTSGNHYL